MAINAEAINAIVELMEPVVTDNGVLYPVASNYGLELPSHKYVARILSGSSAVSPKRGQWYIANNRAYCAREDITKGGPYFLCEIWEFRSSITIDLSRLVAHPRYEV